MITTFKKIGLIYGIFLLIELLAYFFYYEKAYLLPWGITGILVIQLIITVISLIFMMIGLLIQLLKGKSHYFMTKRIFSAVLWLVVTPWMMMLQVVISEMLVHSPDNHGYADLVDVEINGSTQSFSIRGEDLSNPIILFLSGGPGGAQIPTTRKFLSGLEDTYTIVNWDQPGTSKSYDAVYRDEPLTLETYIEDAHALTTYLKDHYHQEKIYLIGESWGSYLSVELATRYPSDYYAVINTGQMVDFIETEEACYQFALDLAHENGNQSLINRLTKLGVPPYFGDSVALDMNTYLNPIYQWMETHRDIDHPSWNTFELLICPEYSIWNSIHIIKGLLKTFSSVYPMLYDIDLREKHQTFEIPFYIFQGKFDQNAPTYLAEDYMSILNAPDKEIVIFEHSGHNPWINEFELFTKEVKLRFTQHQYE